MTPPPPPKTLMFSPPPAFRRSIMYLKNSTWPPWIGGDGDALHVFLQRGVDDLLHRAVVAEVDHLGAGRLQDAAHDVDRGIVAVEQRGGGDEAHLVLRLVGTDLLGNGQVGHGVLQKNRIRNRGCRFWLTDEAVPARRADEDSTPVRRRHNDARIILLAFQAPKFSGICSATTSPRTVGTPSA